MARKPFFRSFDGWWYAQVHVGLKRKQIKLVRGKENQKEAYRAFCRLMAEHEGEIPAPEVLSVAAVCDLFLDHVQRHNHPDTFTQYKYYLQDFCATYGRKMVMELKPIHLSQWLDAHPGWKASRFHAIQVTKRAFAWATSEGVLSKNPFQFVKKPPRQKRERIITPAERTEILSAIRDEPFREFVLAMQETGCRPPGSRQTELKSLSRSRKPWRPQVSVAANGDWFEGVGAGSFALRLRHCKAAWRSKQARHSGVSMNDPFSQVTIKVVFFFSQNEHFVFR
jgi:hypothetical protein